MIRLVPAIDLIDGKCVRLTKGDYDTKKIYNEDPLEVAKQFEEHGIQYLHVVDLDGARLGHIVNYRTLEHIASRTSLIIDFGGGIKEDGDLEIAFNSGARMITGGSIAVTEPDKFATCIIMTLVWLQTHNLYAICILKKRPSLPILVQKYFTQPASSLQK